MIVVKSKFITYLDANNLYGWAMSQYFPYSGFNRFDVNLIGENSPIGYILEVDLKYPDELHELHNDYPLAPEKFESVEICCQIIVAVLQKNMT